LFGKPPGALGWKGLAKPRKKSPDPFVILFTENILRERNDRLNYFFRSLFRLLELILARSNATRLNPAPHPAANLPHSYPSYGVSIRLADAQPEI
jgi:hypothetical protein